MARGQRKNCRNGHSLQSTVRQHCRPRLASILPGRNPCGRRRRIRCIANFCRSGSPSSNPIFRKEASARQSFAESSMRVWTEASVDERSFELARRLREEHGDMSLADFKALVREQFNILLIDKEAALAAIPSMLPPDARDSRKSIRGYSTDHECPRRTIDGRQEKNERTRPVVRRQRQPDPAAPARGCKETAGQGILRRFRFWGFSG